MKRTWIAALFAVPLFFVSAESRAGWQSADYAYCVAFGNGEGRCEGTLKGFRNSPDPWAGAHFSFRGNFGGNFATFAAYANGSYLTCSSWNPGVMEAMKVAAKSRGWFRIQMYSDGSCDGVEISNDSAYEP